MSLDEKTIEELKEKLISRKNKLEEELGLIASSEGGEYRTKFENIGDHKDENATEVEEFIENVAVKESLEQQLKNVKDALQKIENGTYGICESCGGEIKRERLTVNPSARRCMKCAK